MARPSESFSTSSKERSARFENSTPVGSKWLNRVAFVQGVFFIVTGIWPLLHMASFVWVTGPKTDLWLVRTVGGLLTVIGAVLWTAGRRRSVTRELGFLGAGSAAVLVAVDVVYVARQVISPIYLIDAAAEAGIVAAWIACAVGVRREKQD